MRTTLILLLIILTVGCSEEKVTHTYVIPQILNDSIYTVMPGDIILCDKHLAWFDPFSKDYFLHIIDLESGEWIGKMGKIGMGPKEFATPGVSCIVKNRCFYISDYNSQKEAYFSLDSLLQGKDYHISIDNKISKSHDLRIETEIEDNVFFSNTSDSLPFYFKLNNNGVISFFGNYPINDIYMHFGGNIAYNKENGYLVYALWDFPYLALYKKNMNTFDLIWEKKSVPDFYTTNEGAILNNKTKGPKNVAFMKDYIVTIERDIKIDKTDESTVGRDFSKNAQTVFLYDYNGNLKKIVNLKMPIVRMTASPKDNILYAIVVNPEFTLVKCIIE